MAAALPDAFVVMGHKFKAWGSSHFLVDLNPISALGFSTFYDATLIGWPNGSVCAHSIMMYIGSTHQLSQE